MMLNYEMPKTISILFFNIKVGMNIPLKKENTTFRGLTLDGNTYQAKPGDALLRFNNLHYVKTDNTNDWYEVNIDNDFVDLNEAIFEKVELQWT